MKIRLAKKIMKQKKYFFDKQTSARKYNVYWVYKWIVAYDALPSDKIDHRITKAINLTSKKKKHED